MESYNSNNDKPKISLNRKKRMWNRYRNYIAGLAVLVVAVIIFAIVLKSCSNKNSDRQDDTKATTPSVQQESIQWSRHFPNYHEVSGQNACYS